jgi:actin-like ATPase involved in cell morphogenesis/WD40 repeat protein
MQHDATAHGTAAIREFVTIPVMSPGPQGTSLGVDFGTSHTIAVVRRADGSLRPLLFDGAPLMPSAVCADADGGLLVGRDAVHAGRRHPERYEPNPKRLIDRPSTLLGAREYPIADLIAAVLDAVAEECRRVVGHPSQVTLTVPAEWGPARRQVLEDAAARSGLGRQVRLVPEPVAAATYYAEALKHRMAVGSSIVVYDLGAGTFDASVVRRTDHGFETVALDGRNDLGGLDIDAALIEHLGATYGDREGWKRLVNPTTVEERRYFREFQEEVRGAKERLSRHQQSDIAIPLLDVEAHLTRTELEQIAHPHLDQTIRVTQAVIRAAGLDVAASAGVFLVGGASRMPLVGTMLHRSLGLAPTVLDQPEVVVAEGSVLWTAAGQRTETFPIQRPAQSGYGAPLTPAVASFAPPSPQTAPVPRPEPALPQQGALTPAYQPAPQYTPSPQESKPVAPRPESSPARHNLPPLHHTPPVPVDGDDAEPPRTEAERKRARKIGKRAVIAFILVDILIIAGLVWYFGPLGSNEDSFDDGGSGDSGEAWFDPNWEQAETGDLVGELTAAHEGAIVSLASVGVDDENMLFSADGGGTVKQWSMDTGRFQEEYAIDSGVSSLWSATSSAGEPIVVAIDGEFMPHVWSTSDWSFTPAGSFDLAIDMDKGRVRVGSILGEPVLALVNATDSQIYYLEQEYTDGAVPLPQGLAWPNYYDSEADDYTEVVAVGADHQITVTDGITGDPLGAIDDPGDWTEDQAAAGLGIVYDGETPFAMLYTDADREDNTDEQLLHFWDIDAGAATYPAVPFLDPDDQYHDAIVATGTESALMFTNEAREAYVFGMDSWTATQLGDDTTGAVTEMENIVVDGDREFAVTGGENGNIQFWSLGL